MRSLFCHARSLLFALELLAKIANAEFNITGSASSLSTQLTPQSDVACYVPVPRQRPPPPSIDNLSCIKLEHYILLSPYASKATNWTVMRTNYPRRNANCAIGFYYEPPLGDPNESFPEYEIAVAAVKIIDRCWQLQLGGAKFVAGSDKCIVEVEHPAAPTEDNIVGLVPVANSSEGEIRSNSTLPAINKPTTTIDPTSELNATVTCYSRAPPGTTLLPIDVNACFMLFHIMLALTDLSEIKTWTGSARYRHWNWNSCGMAVHGYSSTAIGDFSIIDALIVAAHIAQACFEDRGLTFGGAMSLPANPDFFVSIINTELLGADPVDSAATE